MFAQFGWITVAEESRYTPDGLLHIVATRVMPLNDQLRVYMNVLDSNVLEAQLHVTRSIPWDFWRHA